MSKEKRTLAEKQRWHFQMSKKGAETNTGRRLSDFERGVHLGTAKAILNQRKTTAQVIHARKQKKYEELFAN